MLLQVVWVPGSFEIPLVAKAMAKSGRFDAVLTIGAVVSHIPILPAVLALQALQCSLHFIYASNLHWALYVDLSCRIDQEIGLSWDRSSSSCCHCPGYRFLGLLKCKALQVRGATTHYEAVVNSATGGSLNAGLESGVPVIFGVLTTENMEQVFSFAAYPNTALHRTLGIVSLTSKSEQGNFGTFGILPVRN